MKTLLNTGILLQIEQHAITCDAPAGFAALDALFEQGEDIEVPAALLGRFRLCLTEWVDMGYRDADLLSRLSPRLLPQDEADLSVLDYIRHQLAASCEAITREEVEPALDLLDLVLRLGKGILPPYLEYLAHFWKGRAHRKKGDYELAAQHICSAQMAALAAHAPRLVAVTKIHESWLVFQKGERKAAYQLLDDAEAELRPTGNTLWMGNIQSARGRFIRRSGEYERALAYFEDAIALYNQHYSRHPNLARALVNAAYVKRLMALDLQGDADKGQLHGGVHAQYLKITREALALLKQAETIYAAQHHQGGTGSVLVNAGHLHLCSGDIDGALSEGQRAYDLGRARHDTILTSRARNLQSAAELAKSEEQIAEDTSASAHLAVQYAEEAIDLALQTQNRQLLAEAYLARGAAAIDEHFQDWEKARDCAAKTAALVLRDDRDHLYKQLCQLKARLLVALGVDETLKQWSEGHFGDKTFRQIEEDFAELVIPKIWANLGHSVSRVAQQHSISPKKVRRILQNVGVSAPGRPKTQ